MMTELQTTKSKQILNFYKLYQGTNCLNKLLMSVPNSHEMKSRVEFQGKNNQPRKF